MRDTQKELDIAKNIKLIEGLKSDLLDNVSGLFKGFLQGSQVILKDYLANIVIICYLLARRLGIRYTQFDSDISERIRQNLENGNFDSCEEDLANLEQHFKVKNKM